MRSIFLLAAEKKFWILDPLYIGLGAVLAAFYSVVPDYGFAIVLLTIAVRLILMPLAAKQIRSMRAMQKLQPEIKRLQQKHKDDRQKLNEEMMAFYKEHQVSPFSSCLPLLLQMPLFIVMYRLIYDLVPGKGRLPKHLPEGSAIYKSLVDMRDGAEVAVGHMNSWGMDMAKAATKAGSFGKAWPYYILIAFVILTGYLQQKQTSAMTGGDSAVNQQMQIMGKIFPLFFGVISLSIPAGVVVYFATSNVWQIAQQALMFRRDETAPEKSGADKTVPAGDGKRSQPVASLLERLKAAVIPPTQERSKPNAKPGPKPGAKGNVKGSPKGVVKGNPKRNAKPGPKGAGGPNRAKGGRATPAKGSEGRGAGGNGGRPARPGAKGKPKRSK